MTGFSGSAPTTVTATVDESALAKDATLSSGSQKTQVVDSGAGAVFPAVAVPADGESNSGATATMSRILARLAVYNGSSWDMLRAGITAVSSTLTGFANTLPWAVFHTSPSTRTNGQGGPLEANSSGSLLIAETQAAVAEDNTNGVFATTQKPIAANTYAPSLATNFGAATKANVKGTPGNVLAVASYNKHASTASYLLLHNKATTPAGGDAALYSFYLGALATGDEVAFGNNFFVGGGGAFSTGIGWSIGTTDSTFTDSATAANSNVNIHYK